MEALKDLAVLAFLAYIAKKNLQIGHVLFLSALLFGLLHDVSPLNLGINIYTSLTSTSTLTLFGALFLISLLENIMRHSGSLNRLVSGLKNLSGDPRFAMAALPAIIGMLPSPGGARFSAPLVEEASQGIEADREQKAAVNYWYRHIWEFSLPLYPANILAVEILQIPFSKFLLLMFPYTIAALLIGLLNFRKISPPAYEKKRDFTREAWKQILEGLFPILTIMFLVMAFDIHILLALLAVDIVLYIINVFLRRVPAPLLWPMLKSSFLPKLLYMVFGAIYLRDILVISGSIQQILNYTQTINISPILLIVILAFLMSALTGMTISGVTVAMPMVLTIATPGQLPGLTSLAFAAAYVGLMISPLHLCFIMSIEHFSANFAKTYRKVFLPLALILAFACFYSYLVYII